jgi:hypothetical protein
MAEGRAVQLLEEAISSQDPEKLFRLQAECSRLAHSACSHATSTTAGPLDGQGMALARTISLSKIASMQKKREAAIRTANCAIAVFSEAQRSAGFGSLPGGSNTSSSAAAAGKVWNRHGAVLNEVLATWTDGQEAGIFQRSVQLLQVRRPERSVARKPPPRG